MATPFIIMSAPNGARRQKSDHPKLPITPHDMAICAKRIVGGGASILHLHVRDDAGQHTLDVECYRASIEAVRAVVGRNLIIQATTEAVGIYNRQQQMQMVKTLKPEAVSLALRELCPCDDDLIVFSSFIKWMKVEHIFPQYILYNETDYKRFEDYRKRGLFDDDNPFVLFVLGSYQGRSPEIEAMTEQMIKVSKQTTTHWAVCGFGVNEKNCVKHAALNQGHIRVGFENNILRNQKELLTDNAEMINYSATVSQSTNRPVASAADVRNIFNLRE